MRKFILIAAALGLSATPALAGANGEARVEARGGIAWAGGTEEAFAGIGAGYDFDLGDSAFIGADLGADKVLVNGAKVVWSVGGRLGAKVGTKGRAYVNAGVGFCCNGSRAYIGGGYQHKFNDKLFLKGEYRRSISSGTDINYAGIGLGTTF